MQVYQCRGQQHLALGVGLGATEQTLSLRIAFRALDVEGRSKILPVLLCPRRGAPLTANTCGRCAHFRRVEFDAERQPVLRCVDARDDASPARGADAGGSVQEVVRLPPVCAALDTTIAAVLSALRARPPGDEDDLIPVLDEHAKPRGYVTAALLERLLADGTPLERPLSQVMMPFLTRVESNLGLAEAAELIACSFSGNLVVTDIDGVFLGVVAAEDVRAAGDEK